MIFLTKFFASKKALNKPTESSISSLAPKVLTKPEDIEKIQPYLNKLKETIDAKDVNNIALTGSYGSGKSTILKTFKALNPQYKFLNVSLAAFNQKDGKLEPVEKEKLERLLEVSILQQIFYHVKPEKIPESRFKRIINRKWWHYLLLAVVFIIWVISTILLLKYDYLDKLDPESWHRNKPFSWSGLIFIIISFSGIGFLAKLVLQLFSNSKINKVNIKGELELGENANKSVFNEHLEEILYFFERTDYNVVIIEDLDRFDNTDIFTKLREINILLNNSKLIDQEINFVYAVGDNLIKDKKERVKFFEYIIPVIPFINSSNAKEQLQTLIKEAGLNEDIFSREFMSDVVTFIDDIDMRLLINIFHEFVIYRHALKLEFVTKPEELFAMITYKNIEPEDFSLLNNKQGKLYALINNKKDYIRKNIDQLDDYITEKEKKIQEIKMLSLDDERDLRKIYIYHVFQNLPEDSILEQSVDSLLDDEGFQKIIDNKLTITHFPHYNSYGQYRRSTNLELNFKFSDIEKEVNGTHDYETHLALIREKKKNQAMVLLSEISELKEQKTNLESQDLHQIFQDIDVSIYLTDFSNNNLLRSLIINGYINENYNHYISLFHEGTVTRNDLIFDQNVRGGFNTDFSYKLDKIDGLLETLDLRYFKRESILNYDLVDYLANSYDTEKSKYNALIRLLSNKRERCVQFIDGYIADEDRPIDIFINKLTKHWGNFFYYVAEESNYQGNEINNYLRLILTHANVEDIMKQNHDSLIEMITYNPSFLSLVDTKGNKDLEKKISTLIHELDIKFQKLDDPTDDTKSLFNFVYRNNNYRINKENILQMLKINAEYTDEKAFETTNYAAIKNSRDKHIIAYIDDNINEYVRDIYLGIETNTKGDEQDLIELFNKKNIKTNNSKLISDRMEATISDISVINDDELMFHLLAIGKIKPTWENLHYIYIGYEDVLKDIAHFINSGYNAQLLSNIFVPHHKNKDGKMTYIQMWKDLLASSFLSDEAFDQILKAGNIGIKFFDFENTAKERLETMIKRKSFALDNDVYDHLQSFHSLGLLYLENHKDELLEVDNGFTLDESHLAQIMHLNAYSVDEINNILGTYDITDWTADLFISNLQYRLSKEQGLSVNNLKIIEAISYHRSDPSNVQILNNYFDRFSKSEIRDIIGLLGDKEYHRYLSTNINESLDLEHTSYNEMLFELMIANNYIGDKSKRMKKGGYQIFKNKQTKLL
ncbi:MULTISPECIES: hypothetical protein [unclassified Sphingobacterium]|uniref:YobI family P-loop NTPase n=1 Tax=unclassified Sphingobacterium TaxID=2609468 RepID=UPI0032E4B35F